MMTYKALINRQFRYDTQLKDSKKPNNVYYIDFLKRETQSIIAGMPKHVVVTKEQFVNWVNTQAQPDKRKKYFSSMERCSTRVYKKFVLKPTVKTQEPTHYNPIKPVYKIPRVICGSEEDQASIPVMANWILMGLYKP